MDFSARSTGTYTAEKRGWLRGPHGTDPGSNPSIVVDFSLFTEADHYPNGFIPSGTVVTEAGGPAAITGEDAYGLLFNSETVTAADGKGLNAVVRHGFVDPTRLPLSTGTGSAPVEVQAALPLIDWK